MAVLVTGGAGYIGSVVSEQLLQDGYKVIVLDNLQQGHRSAIPFGAFFIQADINNAHSLADIFLHYPIDAVMHMAAETEVETSMINPQRHFKDNVSGGLNLLEAMLRNNVNRIVFSSSASVYGEPQASFIDEEHPRRPINVYGETKLIFERILEYYRNAYKLNYISLRYFNAAGASSRYGEDHHPETHLIPRVIQAALNPDNIINIYGEDYPTRDGSCVRDYVHVIDIARAHILALKKLDSLSGKAYNLGSGDGYTVKEIVESVKRISGSNLNLRICARRPGDPAVLVASSKLAREELGWQPKYSELDSIIGSAWHWAKQHPQGYQS
jgi:UDP-glucose 4-epimerase